MNEAAMNYTNTRRYISLRIKRLTYSAVFLAISLVLPLLTGQVPAIGSMLCPMHIPVLLCGFVCGWQWGLIVGFVAPILKSLIFGMPAMFPSAVSMAFELAVYGLVSGLMYKLLPRKPLYIYCSLITAMVAGRIAWGLVRFVIAGLGETTFTMSALIAATVTSAVPGIILQLVIIPPLVMLLRRSKLTLND